MDRGAGVRGAIDVAREELSRGRALAGEPATLARAILALREEFDVAHRWPGEDRRELTWGDLERVLDLAVSSAGARSGTLFVADEDSGELVAMLASGRGGPAEGARIPGDAGVRGWVCQRQRVAYVPDYARDRRCREPVDAGLGVGIRNLIAAPVASGGRRLGVLEVANKRENGDFTATDEALVSLHARLAWHWLRAFEERARAEREA